MIECDLEIYNFSQSIEGPEHMKVGDRIDGLEIVEIRNLVNGKPTYGSILACKAQLRRQDWKFALGGNCDGG